MKEEDKYNWNPVKVGENRTSGNSESKTIITGDTTGWDKPTEYDFKAPERERYKYNPDDGILSVFKPKEPEWDANREDRLNRIARVNAFGDFVKHLGAFSGGGYAPTQKREENKGVLRAFAKLDKMRDIYESRKDKYNDQLFGLQAQDYSDQRRRDDLEYERKYSDSKDKANRDWQTAEASRVRKENAYWEGNTTRKTVQSGKAEQFKNLDLLNLELGARQKKGSGKDNDNDFVYRDTDGVFKLDKSRLTQFYSALEKNREDIMKMSPEERKKFGIGNNESISKDLEIMIAALTGKISLNDANFERITSKYMDAFRGSDMMKYALAGSFTPYDEKPDFVPAKTAPFEEKNPGGDNVVDVSDFF